MSPWKRLCPHSYHEKEGTGHRRIQRSPDVQSHPPVHACRNMGRNEDWCRHWSNAAAYAGTTLEWGSQDRFLSQSRYHPFRTGRSLPRSVRPRAHIQVPVRRDWLLSCQGRFAQHISRPEVTTPVYHQSGMHHKEAMSRQVKLIVVIVPSLPHISHILGPGCYLRKQMRIRWNSNLFVIIHNVINLYAALSTNLAPLQIREEIQYRSHNRGSTQPEKERKR